MYLPGYQRSLTAEIKHGNKGHAVPVTMETVQVAVMETTQVIANGLGNDAAWHFIVSLWQKMTISRDSLLQVKSCAVCPAKR